MAKKFTVVHRADKNNVGDWAANPLQYFLNDDEYDVVDIDDLNKKGFPVNTNLIVGGGGLIDNPNFNQAMEDLTDHPDRVRLKRLFRMRWKLTDQSLDEMHKEFTKEFERLIKDTYSNIPNGPEYKVIWGAGHNNSDAKALKIKPQNLEYPDYLIDYDLVGVRDHNTGYQWAPCASCMHPALRKTYTVRNDVIWFEHKKQLIKTFGAESVPRFINSGSNIEQTIELLGSANTIITNSYHGAYWGTLLNKKVIVVDAWSSKFNYMKHKPTFINSSTDWQDIIDDVEQYDNALDECCNATEKFWEIIKQRT